MVFSSCVVLLTCICQIFSVHASEQKSFIRYHGEDPQIQREDVYSVLGCSFVKDIRCVVKKIPYEVTKETRVLPIHYSACYRCEVCLAVAKELDSLFTKIEAAIEYLPRKKNSGKELDPDLLALVLNATCHEAFKRYGIRTDGLERSFSSAAFKGHTTRLPTTLDDQWPDKHRDACLLYVRHYESEKLYADWLQAQTLPDKSPDMVTRLCQSGGVFRDCSSIPLERVPENKSADDIQYTAKTCAGAS